MTSNVDAVRDLLPVESQYIAPTSKQQATPILYNFMFRQLVLYNVDVVRDLLPMESQ